jgi:excisionase family DNA binding protein
MDPKDSTIKKRLVSIKDAAKILSVSTWFLYNATESGKFPSLKLGRRRLIRMEDIEKILKGDLRIPTESSDP